MSRRHLSEMILTVWTVAVIAAFLYRCAYHSLISACVITGIIAFVGNIVLAWLLSFNVHTVVEREKLGWCVFGSSLLISAVIYAMAKVGGAGIFYECAIGLLLCALVCLMLIEKYTALNIELEYLRNTDKEKYLHRMVKLAKPLSVEDEQALMELSDANSIVAAYIKKTRFWRENQEKFLNDRRFSDLWETYFKYYDLTDSEEIALFDRYDAWEIVGLYCCHTDMCEQAELKLFGMPNPEDWVRMYINNSAFRSEKAELKLFELPHAEEFVKLYGSKYAFYNRAYEKAKELGWL